MNREIKHTPGPWKFNGRSQSGKDSFNVIGTVLGGKYKIARCPFINENKLDFAEAETNAQLIAAAPELLEACEAALIELEGYVPITNVETLDKLKVAISKALGKEYQP